MIHKIVNRKNAMIAVGALVLAFAIFGTDVNQASASANQCTVEDPRIQCVQNALGVSNPASGSLSGNRTLFYWRNSVNRNSLFNAVQQCGAGIEYLNSSNMNAGVTSVLDSLVKSRTSNKAYVVVAGFCPQNLQGYINAGPGVISEGGIPNCSSPILMYAVNYGSNREISGIDDSAQSTQDPAVICTASSATPTPTPVPASQCANGIDDDGDGAVDLNDFSCSSAADNDETNPKAQCQDGIDNDGDGKVDMQDPGCSSPQDNTENTDGTPAVASQCSNGIDDDGDGAADMNDFSCSSSSDNDETNPKSQCQDGIDNDADGKIDLADPGCSGRQDNSENTDGTPVSPTATPVANVTNIVTNQTVVVENDDDEEGDLVFKIMDDRDVVNPGEILTYRIIVKNNKNEDLKEIKISAKVAAYLIPVATNPEAQADASTRTIAWNNQTISAKSEVTFAFKVKVATDAPNGFVLHNVATINGPGVRASAADQTTVQAPQIATASISKIEAVPVTAKTGSAGLISLIYSISGTIATAGTLFVKRYA